MKPTQQEIIEQLGAAFDRAVEICGREFVANSLLERFGAGGGEPVYAFRRKGQDSFCTCDENRYLELSEKPNLFEVEIFYTRPSPTDLRAEYVRGLEDAKEEVGQFNVDEVGAIVDAIEALKGKQ